jgi:hypothetical protein
MGFDVLTTCQPSTVWCSRKRLPAAAAQPAKVRQSCSASDYYYYLTFPVALKPRSQLLLGRCSRQMPRSYAGESMVYS